MTNWYDNVPAPTDRNGHVVPLRTKNLVYKGETRGVVSIAYDLAIGMWIVIFEGVVECPRLTHCTLPDSWEQLEEDAAKGVCGYFGMDSAANCKGCPAYEGRVFCECNIPMARDIIRRAKALAGVTE